MFVRHRGETFCDAESIGHLLSCSVPYTPKPLIWKVRNTSGRWVDDLARLETCHYLQAAPRPAG
jgi:hypothetical protein